MKLYRVYNVTNIWKALCGKHNSDDVYLAGGEWGCSGDKTFECIFSLVV